MAETNLGKLIAGMNPVLKDGEYVFATVAAAGDIPALMTFREDEGVTLILPREEAEQRGIDGTFPCRMITLNIHSALDAVGFLARITTALAAEGMGVNPVSAFYHDHLFVPADRVDDAMAVLRKMAASG